MNMAMIDGVAEQARKEERDAIVDWLQRYAKRQNQLGTYGYGGVGVAMPANDFTANAKYAEWFAEAIQRGDHREQQ